MPGKVVGVFAEVGRQVDPVTFDPLAGKFCCQFLNGRVSGLVVIKGEQDFLDAVLFEQGGMVGGITAGAVAWNDVLVSGSIECEGVEDGLGEDDEVAPF